MVFGHIFLYIMPTKHAEQDQIDAKRLGKKISDVRVEE